LIFEALKRKDISGRLLIGIGTVEIHHRNIMEKLNVGTAYGVLKAAVESQ